MTAVSPAPVWEVINGLAAYHALTAALDLGVVDVLAEAGDAGLDAAQLAGAVGAADSRQVAVLADLLVSLGLLDATADRYAITPVAARYLASGSPAQMRDLVFLSPGPAAAWAGLADTIRSGAPSVRVVDEPADFMAPLVEATAPTQRAVAAAVAAHLDDRLPDAPVIVDLGAGSAAWSAAFLTARPAGTAIAVDLPGVVDTTRRLTAQFGDRVSVIADDYLDAPLPDRADVVVLGHVLRSEPMARAEALLHRAIALAGPNGTVVVADYPRPDAPHPEEADRAHTLAAARHELTLSLTMLASTDGCGVTVADLARWSATAGAHVDETLEPLPRQHVLLVRADDAGPPPGPNPTTTEDHR